MNNKNYKIQNKDLHLLRNLKNDYHKIVINRRFTFIRNLRN